MKMVQLSEVCDVVSGATPRTNNPAFWDGDIPWATPTDLSRLRGRKYIETTARSISSDGLRSCAATVLPAGSVLLSSRAPIGHVAINLKPMATNQGFKSLVPKSDAVHASYLYHWLRANRKYLESLGNGATFKEISKDIVSKIVIPLPSLAQQERIAEQLDQADDLRTKRHAALALLDELNESVYLDMFGDPGINPKGWPIGRIGDLLESATYGTSEKASHAEGFPILRMNNITVTGRLDLTDLKYLATAPGERFLVQHGDILFNRTNSAELVGKTAIYRLDQPMAYAGYLVRLRVNSQNDAEYVSAFLNSRYGKRVLRGMCKSIIGMANINARELQSIEIPIPPTQLQREFAHRVSAIQRVRASLESSSIEFDELFVSLRARAFRGEL